MLADANAPYLFGAYVIFVGGMAGYALSLLLRARTARRNEERLAELEMDAPESLAKPADSEGRSSPT